MTADMLLHTSRLASEDAVHACLYACMSIHAILCLLADVTRIASDEQQGKKLSTTSELAVG
jgi:hypothetical protein